jgi:cation diffusion facilitator CzcD-associated flavoprotein CzcO
MANWLESYAEILDLNVWLSSTVTKATYSSESGSVPWTVTVERRDEHGSVVEQRVFKVHHLVMATGLGTAHSKVPPVIGMDKFKGAIRHSMEYKRPDGDIGKKVVVIGACTSGELQSCARFLTVTKRSWAAHDVCADYASYGIGASAFASVL